MTDEILDLSEDERDPILAAAGEAAMAPAASADAYRFSLPHLNNLKPGEALTQTQGLQRAAMAMKLPPATARYLFEEVSRGLAKYGDVEPDANALAVEYEKTKSYLVRTYGQAGTDQMLRETGEILDRAVAVCPWLADALDRSRFSNSAWLIGTLSGLHRHQNRR